MGRAFRPFGHMTAWQPAFVKLWRIHWGVLPPAFNPASGIGEAHGNLKRATERVVGHFEKDLSQLRFAPDRICAYRERPVFHLGDGGLDTTFLACRFCSIIHVQF
jgi:hypothetical protein